MPEKKQEEKKKVDFKRNLKIYLKLCSSYKWASIFLLVLVLIAEGIGLAHKFLFKLVIDNGTGYTTGLIESSALLRIFITIAVVFGVLSIFGSVSNWVQNHLVNVITANMIFDLKKKFFNHINGLSHRFHTTHKTGSLISRLTRGGKAIGALNDFFAFQFSPLILQVIILSGALIYFDIATMFAILFTTGLFVGVSWYISMGMQSANVIANNAEDREKGLIADVFTNIDSVKYFGKENLVNRKYERSANASKFTILHAWHYYRNLSFWQTFILSVGTFFVVFLPVLKFIHGEIGIGTVAFIYTAYLGIVGPLFGFVWGIRRFYDSMTDFDALFDYDRIKNDIEDLPNASRFVVKEGKIEFREVSFKYNERKVLDKINLIVEPGEKVALVGHSGGGKTTFVKLLYRFYDVTSGGIFIDNKDIRSFKQESLRGELSIVPQECLLFDDTVYNNVLFSNPNAKREDVLKAMKFAQLDKFVSNLPDKENTIVGERGVKLSGGEKQRVSIARAILADKRILVLDEATSSLDSKTENEIQKDLEQLMKGRTSIIIAHRLSTIMRVDRIIVMDEGKIAQVGKHADLIKKPGIYRELWDLQKGGYVKEESEPKENTVE